MATFIQNYYRFFVVLGMAAIAVLSFLIGQNEGHREETTGISLNCSDEVLKELAIKDTGGTTVASASSVRSVEKSSASSTTGAFVGSKNGTKYYAPGCSGTARIKPENIIWFQDAQNAELQGYTKGSC